MTAVPPHSRSSCTRQALTAALFLASIALNAWTLYVALRAQPIERSLPIAVIDDPAELATVQHDLAGAYATGERSGDRVITIDGQGGIRFSEVGVDLTGPVDADHYQPGRIGKNLWLSTNHSGHVEVAGIDTLVYYGDRYTRLESVPTPTDVASPPAPHRRPPRVATR